MAEQRFDRLPAEAGLFMQVWADTFLTELETSLDDITASQAALAAQLVLIQAAQSDADDAQDDATATARELARINSYTAPTSVLTAADVGTTATITIAGHDRIYPVQGSVDVPDVTVAGGTIALLAFSTQYGVFYDDTTLADTTPTYQATITLEAAAVGAAAGRHFVGVITTPADAGAPTGGDGGSPPGGGGGFPLP